MSESDKDDEVNFYLTIFGWMQIFCLLVAPAIGQVLDRNLANAIDDPQLGDKPVEDGTIFRRVSLNLQNYQTKPYQTKPIELKFLPDIKNLISGNFYPWKFFDLRPHFIEISNNLVRSQEKNQFFKQKWVKNQNVTIF